MDWSKAKTILIVSFIIINILLVYTLIQDNHEVDSTLDQEFIEDVSRLLANKEIIIETEIPRKMPSLPSLIVKYENLDPSELNSNFFNDNGIMTRVGEGLIELNLKEENITLVNKKYLIYESNKNSKQYSIKNEDHAIEIALNFLKDRNIEVEDMELSYVKYIGGKYSIEFSKLHEERYLESAFTNIQIDNTGVKRLERQWLDVVETGESQIYISSAPKSLLSLLTMKQVHGKTIKDISLSYYFDPGKHEYIQDPDAAKEGRTIPAWRIQFKDGYKIFLDDY